MLPEDASPASLPAPAVRRNPAVNVLWNWAGVGVDAVIGLLVTGMLFRGLGEETYGLWILIGSMTGCFGMLDLGMRGAVGRFVAFYHAKGDHDAVEQVLSTAAVALIGVGLVSLVAAVGVAWALPRLYAVPAAHVASVQLATLIVGLQLALYFVLRMFDAALWGYQRFDLLNLIDIPTALLRGALIAWLVASGGGLVSLAWISLATVAGSGLAKCWFTYRMTPGLHIRVGHATGTMLRDLIGYGFWNFIISLTAMARSRLSPLLVGALIGVKAVASFSIVMRLPSMAAMILTAATGVFTPLAVAIHVQRDEARRQRLLIEGTRLSLSLALYFLALFVWLGKPLLSIWIGPEFAAHWPLLVIIGCGEVLPMTMSVAAGMILAMARHRGLAWLVVAETATALAAAALLGSSWGLVGFVTALACTATFYRGVCVLWHICRLTSIAPLQFTHQALVAPLMCAAVACALLHVLVTKHPVTSWLLLFGYTTLFTAAYALLVAWGVVGWHRTLASLRFREQIAPT